MAFVWCELGFISSINAVLLGVWKHITENDCLKAIELIEHFDW
jgi:hypothetical protein